MRLINLIPLHEIDFPNQRAFDSYNKVHKLRPDTKVVVAGRVTTAGRAAQNSPSPVKGTSVFGGDDKEKAVNKEKYPVGTKFFKPNGNQNIEVVRVEGDKIFVVSDIMPGKEWQWREDGIDDDIKNKKLQVKSTKNKISGGDKEKTSTSSIPKAQPGSFLDAFQKINPGYDANKTLADFSKESETDLDDKDTIDPEDRADHEAYVKSATEWFNKVATTKPTVKPGDLVKVNMKSIGKEGIGKIVKPITMQGNYGFMGQVAPDKQPAWKIDCYTEKNIGTDKKPIDVNGKKYYYQGTLYYPQHEEGDKEAFSKLGGDKEKTDVQNPQTTIKNIADLTDNNDHNGAVMALAKMMGDKSSTAEMEKIQRYHELKGHMPQSLTKYRSSILNNLLVQAKKKYGDKIAKQLHSSF